MDVGPDIEFEEIREAGDTGEEAWPDPLHGEGNEAEVCFAVMEVDVKSVGEAGLDQVRGDFPVEEEEISPALEHDGAAGGMVPAVESLGESGRSDGHSH